MKQPEALAALYDNYDVFLCDVWGVIHNGVEAWPAAVRSLAKARQAGKQVILITNAPRPQAEVAAQLQTLGVTQDSYDAIVTSGDVTRGLISEVPGRVFYIGPPRDLALFDGLAVDLVEEYEASSVVCTGLFDDETETPEDYNPLLRRLRSRNLPFICANPDIVVQRGDRIIWCAGALARDYSQLGGRTQVAGKPHRLIYEAALALAEKMAGAAVDKSRVLAIGDGILTDIKGAEQNGLDALLIGGGIHAADYAPAGVVDQTKLEAFLKHYGMKPAAFMMELV